MERNELSLKLVFRNRERRGRYLLRSDAAKTAWKWADMPRHISVEMNTVTNEDLN